ncbi:MAG: signal peptidase II [Candidatus Eisenbacteria bacterium]
MRDATNLPMARPLLLGAAVVAADQGTKWIVGRTLARGESVPLVGDVFRFTHVQNPGGAFGLFRDSGSLFTFLSVAAVIFLFWTVRRYPARATGMRIALGLVLGGAVGNLIDRIRTSRVVDFFDVGFGDLRWPVFNVADVAVVVGVGLFLLVSWKGGGPDGEGAGDTGGGEDELDRASGVGGGPA